MNKSMAELWVKGSIRLSFHPYLLQFLTIAIISTPSWGKGERHREEKVRNSDRDTSLEILQKYSGQTKTLQKLTLQKRKITTTLLYIISIFSSRFKVNKILPIERS